MNSYRIFGGRVSYFSEIHVRLSELEKWQRVTIAWMSAASVLPIVNRFSKLTTQQMFEQGLSAVRKFAHEGSTDSDAVKLRAALDGLPESACDDSEVPAFEVTVVLGVLGYALDAIIKDDSAKSVRDACALAANCYSGYDHVVAHGNKPLIIDPQNPPAPGRLESIQIQSQFRLIEVARSSKKNKDGLIEEAKILATKLASEISSVLPIYCQKRGWN
jgi:hypothetical protein